MNIYVAAILLLATLPFIFCDKMQLIILTKKRKKKRKTFLYSIDPYIDDVVIHMGYG